MPNPYGRTEGSKNRKGHNAGGARTGAGRKTNEERQKILKDGQDRLKKIDQEIRRRNGGEKISQQKSFDVKRLTQIRDRVEQNLEVLKNISSIADDENNFNVSEDQEFDIYVV